VKENVTERGRRKTVLLMLMFVMVLYQGIGKTMPLEHERTRQRGQGSPITKDQTIDNTQVRMKKYISMLL